MFESPFGVREGSCRYGGRKEGREAFGVRLCRLQRPCRRFRILGCTQAGKSGSKLHALQTLARFLVTRSSSTLKALNQIAGDHFR